MAFATTPEHSSYDVVIIGGAIMGSATAWFLTDAGFDGRVLVIERDPTYAACSTAHTNSCIRQQFSTELNVRISQFAAEFITHLPERMGAEAPRLSIHNFGYMYLAGSEAAAATLRANLAVQHACGAATQLLDPDQIRAAYPFYRVDDIVLGAINTVNEGYWDGAAVFDAFRREARAGGVEYIKGEVAALDVAAGRVQHVVLADGTRIGCGQVVNAAGPRAARVAAMAGIDLPVEPRKRYTWVFKAERPLDRDLPLTIDPSGVHVREVGGGTYQAGGHPDHDPAVAPDDFGMDQGFWQDHVWPTLAARIPAFEAVKVTAEWAGHYAMNTLDHNAVLGPHPDIRNFHFQNGFSGHGLQQSPAMGRGTAEWLMHGRYETLDLRPFHYDRIAAQRPILETAVI
ncbi:MAG: FAD-binding oxidoreductase [Pseudomonadota bacterium]